MSLQTQLKRRMQEQSISVAELERRAGLKMSAVKNILSGASKKPSAETILSISKVLGCSVEELLGNQETESSTTFSPNESEQSSLMIEDMNLFIKTTESVGQLLAEHEKKPSFTDLTFIIREVYNYSLKNSFPDVDEKFAEWLIEQRKV